MLRSVRVRSSSGRAGPGPRRKPPPNLATRADSGGCQPELVPAGAAPPAGTGRPPHRAGPSAPRRAQTPDGPRKRADHDAQRNLEAESGGGRWLPRIIPPASCQFGGELGQIPGYMVVVARRLRITPESLRMHRPLNRAPGSLELSGNERRCSQWHAHVVSGTRTSTACTGSVSKEFPLRESA